MFYSYRVSERKEKSSSLQIHSSASTDSCGLAWVLDTIAAPLVCWLGREAEAASPPPLELNYVTLQEYYKIFSLYDSKQNSDISSLVLLRTFTKNHVVIWIGLPILERKCFQLYL
jgi:hypothetical protein